MIPIHQDAPERNPLACNGSRNCVRADMGREVNLSRLIDITGETSLALAFGTRFLAAPMIFLKMKTIILHDDF